MKCWLLILSSAIMSNQILAQTHKTLIIAHRGASGSAPENTLAAINKALEIGADIVEIDVHLSNDNQVVVIHDNTLDRTSTLKGNVKDHTLKGLKNADAGSWFSPEFKNERIPTLDEVLYTINGKAKLLIEIKDGSEVYPGIEKLTVEAVKRNGAENWCELQSFSDAAVKKMLEEKSSMPVYKLVVGNVPLLPLYHDGKMKSGSAYQYKDVTGINPNYRFARKRVLKKLHERKQKMYVWTVNDEKTMKKLLTWGVDGIITNYPEKLKSLINQ
ncbi:MAG: Glycerophosphodiester phosphodiesterase [Bacteroidia bacterium]|nr:Glycerophosphodiester phosphodiesterase [Bacteroidia bacterium]